MDEGPSTDTIQSLHTYDSENYLFINKGFNWARLTGPRNRDRNLCIILTFCLSCLVVVTAMAIIANSQIASTQKLNADSLNALKASLLSELQDVKPNAKYRCPDHWILFAGKCYFFSTSKDNFGNARTACQSSQSSMVVINNKMEQDFLARHAHSQFYWIGLTDMINEGVWRWEDGTSYSSTPKFWKPGQPNDYGNGEDCAHFIANGLWNDDPCNTNHLYICEKMPI
uniref:hepatic lectin-like n=1 Tax=Pristiophorus japonicus TaxID=55135 RepID=UPI00398EE26F